MQIVVDNDQYNTSSYCQSVPLVFSIFYSPIWLNVSITTFGNGTSFYFIRIVTGTSFYFIRTVQACTTYDTDILIALYFHLQSSSILHYL